MIHPSTEKLVRIREAAEVLGVSIDTVRRWEKKGLINSIRTSGGQRVFDLAKLRQFKTQRPLTISEAAKLIGVSTSSLRRFEETGLIVPERNKNGERIYTRTALHAFSNRKARQKQQEKEPKEQQPTLVAPKAAPKTVERVKKTAVSVAATTRKTIDRPATSSVTKVLLPGVLIASAIFLFVATTDQYIAQQRENISDKDCLLFLWVVDSKIKECIDVGEVWGFNFIKIGFIWHKKRALLGNYTMNGCEICLIFKNRRNIEDTLFLDLQRYCEHNKIHYEVR